MLTTCYKGFLAGVAEGYLVHHFLRHWVPLQYIFRVLSLRQMIGGIKGEKSPQMEEAAVVGQIKTITGDWSLCPMLNQRRTFINQCCVDRLLRCPQLVKNVNAG